MGRCPRFDRYRVHCPGGERPSYKDLTSDMQNLAYEFIMPGVYRDGDLVVTRPDNRYGKCRGIRVGQRGFFGAKAH
jgi:hypothetical protein